MSAALKYLIAFTLGGCVCFALLLGRTAPNAAEDTRTATETEPASSFAAEDQAVLPLTPPQVDGTLLDRQTSLREISRIPTEYAQSLALYQRLAGEPATAIEALLDQAESVFSGQDYAGATAIMYGRLAELDFPRALARAQREAGPALDHWLNAIFHAVARIDFDRAVETAETLPALQRRVAARALLGSRNDLSQTELSLVAERLDATLPLHLSGDPAAAWAQAALLPNLQRRLTQISGIAVIWARSDPDAAMRAAAALPQRQADMIQKQVLAVWAELDFDQAWLFVQSVPSEQRRTEFITTLVSIAAQQNLARAKSLAMSLPARQQIAAVQAMGAAWVQEDPLDMLAWLDQQNSNELNRAVIPNLASVLAQDDSVHLEQFISRLDPDMQTQARLQAVNSLARRHPERAAAYVEQMQDGRLRANAARSVVYGWAQQDPAAALNWIDTRPRDDQGPLYTTYVQILTQWSSDEAMRFARNLDDPRARDHALLGLVHGHGDLEALEALHGEFSDPELQSRYAKYLYRRLQRTGPGEGEAFRLRIAE